MLKKTYRLKRREDFRLVYKRGRSKAGSLLVLYARKNGLSHHRVGFSVSKKVGKAVERNRVKRQLREICRLNPQWFKPGFDYIFIARSPIKSASFGEKTQGVKKLLLQQESFHGKNPAFKKATLPPEGS